MWKCVKYPKVFAIVSDTGRQIAIMTKHHGDDPTVPMHAFARSKQDERDANLIAAAPELLEITKAYRNLLKTMAHTEGQIATYHHIENVLAKISHSE